METINARRFLDNRDGGLVDCPCEKLAFTGKPSYSKLTEDGRQRIVAANKGRPKSPEAKRRMKESAKKRWMKINLALAKSE